MDLRHTIVIGDSRQMEEIPDESVHLVVTSPPYWQLKDYGCESQLGFNNTYEEYINNLNLVWYECRRVLYPGCRLCINIGDQFARSVYYGRYKVVSIKTEIVKFCENMGFDYMGAVIWQKLTTCNTTGGGTVMGSFPYPRNGVIKVDYEHILLFRKPGDPPPVSKEIKEASKLTKEEWKQYFTGHWSFPGEKQGKHLAMFPEELPKRLIKMFSFVGETVLDPFLGSGTTSLAAKNLNRSSIGYEINHNFLPVIEEKLGINQASLFPEGSFQVIYREKPLEGIEAKLEGLPYIFKDPVRIDKWLNRGKSGSGVQKDGCNFEKEEYHGVKEVLSPELLVLNNGVKVRLLGVKEKPESREEAVRFLRDKTKGQKVFLRFDQERYDSQHNLLCYLYLKNKTFLNAHLIKSATVCVDEHSEYKCKTKFLALARAKQGK